MDSRRRQGEPRRHHPGPRPGRPGGRCADSRGRQGHGRQARARPRGGSAHLAGRHHHGSPGELRGHVGARARPHERRHRTPARLRAHVHRHQPHRWRHLRSARDARWRRPHLLQGRGGGTPHGRLRSLGQALGHGGYPRGIQLRNAPGRLGQVRDPHAQCHRAGARARDGPGPSPDERAGELHAGQLLHPGRSARGAPLLRRGGLLLGWHRDGGRSGAGPRGVSPTASSRAAAGSGAPRSTSASRRAAPASAARWAGSARTGLPRPG